MNNRLPLSFFLIVLFAFQGCASPIKGSEESTAKALSKPEVPLILIPGTSRTKLVDTHTGLTVWGNLFTFFGRHPETALSLPVHSANLEENRNGTGPGELLEGIAIIPKLVEMQLYSRFFKILKQHGYRRGDIDHPKPDDNFFVFTYDWRLPHDTNAILLAEKIEKLKASRQNPDLKFDLISHSSAVFIARYYALYGSRAIRNEENPEPDFSGAKNLRKLILVNPSHQGLLFAFKILHEGFRPVHSPFMRRFTPYEIFTHPAFFVLLPRYDTWPFVDPRGLSIALNLYDAENWTRYGWSVFKKSEKKRRRKAIKKRFPVTWEEELKKEDETLKAYLQAGLDRALLLQRAVNEKDHALPASLETHVFVTEWGPTPERVCIDFEDQELYFDQSPCQASLYSEGDHIVTSASLRGQYEENPPHYIFLREEHRRIANNKKFHKHILRILLGSQSSEASDSNSP